MHSEKNPVLVDQFDLPYDPLGLLNVYVMTVMSESQLALIHGKKCHLRSEALR
jgi:hypothetical protein